MQGKQVTALAGVLLVVGLLAAVGPSQAKSTKTPVDVWEVACLENPGIRWLDDEGVLHIRGQVTQATFYDAGDFAVVGSDTIVSNANLDPATFTGNLFGTWSAIYLPASDSGTFDGSWNGLLFGGGVGVGKAVAQGTGELRGMKMKLNILVDPADPPPPDLFSAPDFPPCDPFFGISHDTGFIHNRRGD